MCIGLGHSTYTGTNTDTLVAKGLLNVKLMPGHV